MPNSSFPVLTATNCPFVHGPATIDALLAEMGHADIAAIDAALDLRGAMVARRDPGLCIGYAARLGQLLANRNYLAFYRVRRWLVHEIHGEATPGRGSGWTRFALPIDLSRVGERAALALAALARAEGVAKLPLARVRLAFAEASPPAGLPLPSRGAMVS
jgi:hypothetical protein